MAIFQNYTGLTADTPQNLILDAGMFWVGINETALRATGLEDALDTTWSYNDGSSVRTITPTRLGATRGGATFDLQKEERQIEVNGARVPLMGMDRVDSMMPILSVTLLEMANITTMLRTIGQGTSTETASGYTEIVPKIDIELSDYLPNVALLTRTSRTGDDRPVIIVVRNCKIVENAPFEFEDPGEMAAEVSFRGATPCTDAFTVPVSVYIPILAGSGS